MRNPARPALAVGIALALLTARCGSSSDSKSSAVSSTGASAPTSAENAHVEMKALDFSPTAVAAKVGQRVVWTNEDSSPHNVTYVSGPRFKSSRRFLNTGQKFSLRLTAAGTIHYVCTLHPWMKATIVVSP